MTVRIGFALVGLCATLSWAAGCGVEADQAGLGSSGETHDTQEFSDAPARGVSILEVEINQGTKISIGVGGEWIAETERPAALIANRDALLRVHYTVDAGWVPREIEARLTLVLPGGSIKSFSDVQMVEGDSDPADLDGPFQFELATIEGETVPEARYAIELREVQVGGEALDEGAWANPAGGPQPIGFELVPLQIKTLLVPIIYQGTTANLDEATTQELIDNLYEQNPTSEILYDVREPAPYDGQLIDLANLLPVVAQLRSSDNADPNVYYHALVDVGASSVAGLYGISGIANDTDGDAGNRVSATVLWSPNPGSAAETYTHETGHAQGLAHVECANANAAETDGTYPHSGGGIGNWGYGIRRWELFDPAETYDYMSYCAPSWVSDWTWNKTYERIRTLTAWDFAAGAGAGTSKQLLVVAVSEDGRRQWWTMPGTIDPARVDGRERIEFETSTGEIIEADADVTTLSDDRTRWIRAALPSELGMSDLARIRHVRADEVASVEAHALAQPVASNWRPNWKVYRSR